MGLYDAPVAWRTTAALEDLAEPSGSAVELTSSTMHRGFVAAYVHAPQPGVEKAREGRLVDLVELGGVDAAGAVERERGGFLDWLSGVVGAPTGSLTGATKLAAYDTLALPELLGVLQTNQRRLGVDPAARTFRERLEREWSASLDRLGALRADLFRDEALADDLVFEVYGLTVAQRALVDAEFTPPAP